MTNDGSVDGRRGFPWRVAGWSAAAGLVLLPLAAMQFSREFAWTAFDFVMIALVVGSAGIGIELSVRARNRAFIQAAGIAVMLSILLGLIAGAVGIIGSENEPSNLLFAGVIAVALGGSLIAMFRPAGMAVAMTVAAVAQAAVPVVASVVGDSAIAAIWAPEVIVLTVVFTLMWLVSARLFRVAAREA